jgi:hypothetical protein
MPPSKPLGPLHRTVKNAQYSHGVATMKVRNDVRQSRDHQLARAFDATGSSHTGMLFQHFYLSNDFCEGSKRGFRAVAPNVLLDRIEVAIGVSSPV